MIRIIRTITYLIVTAMLSACISDDYVDEIKPEESRAAGLLLRIYTSGDGMYSRSATIENGSGSENQIDIYNNDYRIFLFAAPKGNEPQYITNLIFYLERHSPNYAEYVAKTSIPEDVFENMGIDKKSDTEIDFRILMLANWNSLGGVYPLVPDDFTTVSDIIALQRSFTPVNQGIWQPFTGRNKGIPMCGKVDFSVRYSELVTLSSDNSKINSSFYDVPTLFLMRAMTKLEIVDGRPGGIPDNGYPYVADVSLLDAANIGLLVPNGIGGGETPFPSPSCPAVMSGERGTFVKSSPTHFVYYGAEQSFDRLNGTLEITVAYAPERIKIFRFPVSELKNAGGHFLRNQIYRYYLVGLDETELDMELEVSPWISETSTSEWSDNINVAPEGHIKWQEGTYGALSSEDAIVVSKEDLTPLRCTFTIPPVKDGLWKAVFVSRHGNPKSFAFLDSSGNEVMEMTGNLNGSPIQLTIKPLDDHPEQQNSVMLDFYVTLPSGTTVRVDLLSGNYGTNRYFTIIQNQIIDDIP